MLDRSPRRCVPKSRDRVGGGSVNMVVPLCKTAAFEYVAKWSKIVGVDETELASVSAEQSVGPSTLWGSDQKLLRQAQAVLIEVLDRPIVELAFSSSASAERRVRATQDWLPKID